MQAITVKYLGPTNHKGSRLVARSQAKKITIPWDYSLNQEDNYIKAAKELMKSLNWDYDLNWGYDYRGEFVATLSYKEN